MEHLELIRINAAGRPGVHGSSSEHYKSFGGEAGLGSDGAKGESATRPSPGTSAGDVQVRLYYDDSHPATVQIAGEGAWAGKVFSVARDQLLHVDCKGGDGGRGGRGQDGQSGGMGLRGRDATRYRHGEKGGTGGRGGDGGFGSNGADGGNGGNVLISVGEDDLDLLVGCTWDTSGGLGGISGQHGNPGAGGTGGKGGSSYSWTERSGDHTYHYTNPAGAAGDSGPPGSIPSTYLSGGKNGREGSTQIRVLRKDLTEATYPGKYDLEVVSFEVIDENADGVNEPGEHLIVQKIRVKNKGQMPSPESSNPITVLIQGTSWLEPIESEPVVIPPAISPNEIVEVPGRARAFIRNESNVKGVSGIETHPRAVGEPLRVDDHVSLVAIFNHRLGRALPKFCSGQKYTVSYPLELTPPKYLESVQKGDKVRFSWTLRNVSRKPHGYATLLARHTATRFSDPGKVFHLPHSNAENGNLHEAIDALDELQPGQEVPIEQDFVVSPGALEYSDASLRLELLFADPHRNEANGEAIVRSIMTYEMHLQVASVYAHTKTSRFLLIVNSKTPNYAIHQILSFVRNDLRVGIDVYNISLTGSLRNTNNAGCVLNNYRGRSIIVYGNSFPFFGQGLRSPWQFMDAWTVNALARSGTGFLFCDVSDEAGLKQWASATTFSGLFNEKEAQSVDDLAAVITENALSMSNHGQLEKPPLAFLSPKSFGDKFCGCFGTSSPHKHAERAAIKSIKDAPLQRFMFVSDEHDAGELPTLLAIQGLEKGATLLCSSQAPVYNSGFILSDHLKYAMLSTLPFMEMARIFWNCWQPPQTDEKGLVGGRLVETIYAGLDWQEMPEATDEPAYKWQNKYFDSKLLDFICLIIESQVGLQIAHFLSGKIKGKDTLKQVPKLDYLLHVGRSGDTHIPTTRPDQLVLKTLGTVQGALMDISIGDSISSMFGASQKTQLRKQFVAKLNDIVKSIVNDSSEAEVMKGINDEAAKTKLQIKAAGGAKDLAQVLLVRQAALTQVNNALIDLAALNPHSIAVTEAGLGQMRQGNENRTFQRDADEKDAIKVLGRHVNPEDSDEEE